MNRARWTRIRREIPWVAAFCAAYTLFRTLTAQGYMHFVRNASVPFMKIFPGELIYNGLWGVFFFVVRALSGVFQRRIRRRGQRLAAYALMSVLTPPALRLLSFWMYGLFGFWPYQVSGTGLLGLAFSSWLYYDYILYAIILGLVLFFDAFKREREYRIARLQTELRRVTFRNLGEELRPRFVLALFDELCEQIERDPDRAGRTVSRFSDWLRALQRTTTSLLVPFKDELRFFESYVDIKRLCRGDRRLVLDVRLDDAAREWPVPPLLLQPLAEEALNRLDREEAASAAVTLDGSVEGGLLRIRLSVEFVASPGEAPGAGADGGRERTREKLAALYGEDFSWGVREGPGASLEIDLGLPRHMSDDAARVGGNECAS